MVSIREMPRPTDVQGVQRLIGVVTYLAKFLPQLSTVCEPLRRLTDSQAVFDWLPQHEAFIKNKELITQAPVLRIVILMLAKSQSNATALMLA